MKTQELLDVMRVQRHDFLNHLQVISGFLQLNKSDRAKEYIDQISSDIRAQSVIARLEVPELKAVLMVAVNDATKYQVEFTYDINTRLENCSVPGESLAEPVGKCIKLAMDYLSHRELENRQLYLSITEEDGIIFRIGLPGLSLDVMKEIKNKLPEQDIEVVPERSELYFIVSR
ncbi:MAG: histidine kinase [Firmicutes bacterium]|nr:histidine kinase [Bacillota bacterium]